MNQKPNLVMGAVTGHSFEQLQPFLQSLQRSRFQGDVVMLWCNLAPETLDALRRHGVKLVKIHFRGRGILNSWSRFWPKLAPCVRLLKGSTLDRKILKLVTPFLTARFFACHDFLRAHAHEYRYVLLTDMRDVIFQEDPFVGFGGGLTVFEEDCSLPLAKETLHNTKWVEELFGSSALQEIGQYPILCAGTIMGDLEAMVRYLAEFESLLCQVRNLSSGADQGLHNFLCRVKIRSWVQVSKNGSAQVLTMGPTLKWGIDAQISSGGLVVNRDGIPIPVLHQYDRHEAVANQLIQKLLADRQ